MLSFLFRITLLAFAWVFASSAALAHRPYLSPERAPLVLDNGTPAELRLLYGDGILMSDPVRPIVVGEKGEIHALGPHGEAVAFTCAEQDCRVFIVMAGASLPYVFILDRATFKYEPVYRFSLDDPDVSDSAQRAEETFGFRAVPLKPGLLTQSIMAFLAGSPLSTVFLVLLGLGFWPTCLLAIDAARAGARRKRVTLAMASVACALMTFVFSLFAGVGLSLVSGFPPFLAELITGATAGLVLLCVALGELWRSRRIAAA
ncbi:MAG: hypothetical protein QOG74_983 [Alphaproteobacteria bacterium]|nr:hypothetical protein [Alphaproteobacteria bacterium]